ncbi:MAG: pyridoxamine 5'-phosphate oxidase family protein [Deltaproteobacteria bacterium]|nr:pyridoxamine 5'-phosphate oxidase family protein [Deltaproteobacteria bacterium]
MTRQDVFHEGEVSLQERSGSRSEARRNGAMIAATLHPAMRSFLAEQRMLALAAPDAQGGLSAHVLFGVPGMATAEEGQVVTLGRSRLLGSQLEPPWADLVPGTRLGLLAIDLATRRRLRVNGTVSSTSDEAVRVTVTEVFPNCPKYIQRRRLVESSGPPAGASLTRGTRLDEARRDTIQRSDTLFVASHHPRRGADVSHRGGAPGFVQILDDQTLRIPDYPGNGMFQTLGNLAVSRDAGLAFVDFARGRILQLSGRTSLRFDVAEDSRHPTGGTGRSWDFQVEGWIESLAPAASRWELLERSPFNPVAGGAPQAG